MAKTLNQIIAALTQEMANAALQADVHRAQWQAIYDEHEILREFTPSRIRVREMKVSIPLALEKVDESKPAVPELTQAQIARILPQRLSKQDKTNFAARISALLQKQRLHLLSADLEARLEKAALSAISGAKAEELDMAYLQNLQREYQKHPDIQRQASFVYKASELEKVNPQHLIRIDLSIDLD